MKIDKAKLNTLLKSGLNPEITTRKQLAARLEMDPTSLTRWFATRDRLGNPRFPVVPDRHVTTILELFQLAPEALSLDDDAFREHCFNLSVQGNQSRSKQAEQAQLRLQKIAERQLKVEDYSAAKKKPLPKAALLGGAAVVASVWWLVDLTVFSEKPAAINADRPPLYETPCWQGYSAQLGDFGEDDSADPCHYRKLYQNALAQLRNEPKSERDEGDWSATRDYLLFLSGELDKRRLNDKIALHVELGKLAFNAQSYASAREYFQHAKTLLATSTDQNPTLKAEIATHLESLKNLDK